MKKLLKCIVSSMLVTNLAACGGASSEKSKEPETLGEALLDHETWYFVRADLNTNEVAKTATIIEGYQFTEDSFKATLYTHVTKTFDDYNFYEFDYYHLSDLRDGLVFDDVMKNAVSDRGVANYSGEYDIHITTDKTGNNTETEEIEPKDESGAEAYYDNYFDINDSKLSQRNISGYSGAFQIYDMWFAGFTTEEKAGFGADIYFLTQVDEDFANKYPNPEDNGFVLDSPKSTFVDTID